MIQKVFIPGFVQFPFQGSGGSLRILHVCLGIPAARIVANSKSDKFPGRRSLDEHCHGPGFIELEANLFRIWHVLLQTTCHALTH